MCSPHVNYCVKEKTLHKIYLQLEESDQDNINQQLNHGLELSTTSL